MLARGLKRVRIVQGGAQFGSSSTRDVQRTRWRQRAMSQTAPGHAVDISVLVCTRNPRPRHLERAIEALRAQTLAPKSWELLLVDNGSDAPLAARFDLSWHPHARHVREDDAGLVPARVCGIRESSGKSLVFVDDDNVLNRDYLERALQIGAEQPHLGAWGGAVVGEFEETPPDWIHDVRGLLSLREVPQNRWTNLPVLKAAPCGVGLVVRRRVALAYADGVSTRPLRRRLGPRPGELTGHDDFDLAFSACDLGLGMGRFTALVATHLIPPERTDLAYLERMQECTAYSELLFWSIRSKRPPIPSRLRLFIDHIRSLGLSRVRRRLRRAELAGLKMARRDFVQGRFE